MHANIVTLPGDGIGVEVVAEGIKVLKAVADTFCHTFTYDERLMGGCAIDAAGNPLPDETLAACRAADAVLLGAVGGPKWSDPAAKVRPEQGLLGLRKGMGLYANLRPIQIYPMLRDASPLHPSRLDGVDLVVVRELTGGIYFGDRKEATDDDLVAYDTMIYSEPEVDRITRKAFELARLRRGHVEADPAAGHAAADHLHGSGIGVARPRHVGANLAQRAGHVAIGPGTQGRIAGQFEPPPPPGYAAHQQTEGRTRVAQVDGGIGGRRHPRPQALDGPRVAG